LAWVYTSANGSGHDDQRFRWSGPVRWACQDLNLGPRPCPPAALVAP